MSMVQNLSVNKSDAISQTGESRGLSDLRVMGVEGLVAEALNYLRKILLELSKKNLQQKNDVTKINSEAIQGAAKSIKLEGDAQFKERMAQGITGIVGSAASLGIMGGNALIDPYKTQINQLKEEQTGIYNYKDALMESASRPNISEQETSLGKEVNTNKVDEFSKALEDKASFVDQNGKAHLVSEEEKELMNVMSEGEKAQLQNGLDQKLNHLTQDEQAISHKQAGRSQTGLTIGQSMNSIISASGIVVGAQEKKKEAEYQSNTQLLNGTSQQTHEMISQLNKTANDALSQAEQTSQTLVAVSNSSRSSGG